MAAVLIGILLAFLTAAESADSPSGRGGHRSCPICNAHLGQDDRLFADQLDRADGTTELKIKGCTYCYERPGG